MSSHQKFKKSLVASSITALTIPLGMTAYVGGAGAGAGRDCSDCNQAL